MFKNIEHAIDNEQILKKSSIIKLIKKLYI